MDRKVIALGESVLDIIFKNGEPQAARPGGSSFNSIISVGRAGIPAVFISETGQDRVGAMIVGFLKENGVDTAYVIQYPGSKSALSLAFLNERNDAEYEFYKDYPRQRLGNAFPELSANDILLFGSFYALNPVLRPKVKVFLEQARKSRTMVIYDPNFRSSHMDDLHQLRLVIEENFAYASVVRCSDEDLRNIYGATNIDEAWEKVAPFCSVLIYTANAHGVWLRTPALKIRLDVEQFEPLSTIGAGDSFNAGLIYGLYTRGLTKEDLGQINGEEWKLLIDQAVRFSSDVCRSYDNYISHDLARMLRNSREF